MFLLSANHAHHGSLRIVGAQGFGIPVFELVLLPIERKQAISARSQSLRNETSIRTHPYLGELPAAVRKGNAVDMRRGLPTERCIKSPASCVAACAACAACIDRPLRGRRNSLDCAADLRRIVAHRDLDGRRCTSRADDQRLMLQVEIAGMDRGGVAA